MHFVIIIKKKKKNLSGFKNLTGVNFTKKSLSKLRGFLLCLTCWSEI